MNLFRLFLLSSFTCICISSVGQVVRIGDTTGTPDPKAILQLQDTTRGFLLPRMTQTHMTGIAAPTDGLLVYNNTAGSIYQYKQSIGEWRPIIADSSDWVFDPGSGRLYLRKALNNTDSIYYQANTRKFFFGDSRYFIGTTGAFFNLDDGNSDKHIFKATASRFPRSASNLNSSNVYSLYEIDDDPVAISNPFVASYTGLAAAAFTNPSATQKISDIIGLNYASGNASQDTVLGMYGIIGNTYTRGNSYTEVMMGNANFLSVGGSNSANVGEMYGNYTSLSYVTPATSTRRIIGNVYGHFINHSSALNNKVDGAAYGIFITNVRGSSANNNFGIYTNKGHNRFGDSTLITDGAGFKARAVLDVNTTSSMIIPVGTTAQRPVTPIIGMLRYNSDAASPESYTASGWVTLKPSIPATASIDPPLLPSGSTVAVVYAITGAAIGNTVTVSPAAALPNGYFVAGARVSAVNQVEITFGNFSGAGIDLPLNTFYIKVMQ